MVRLSDESLPEHPVEPHAPTPAASAAISEAPKAVRRSMPAALSIALGLLIAIAAAWTVYYLGWFLLLCYLAFVLASILDAPVSWLEARGYPRALSATVLMVSLVLLTGGILYFAGSYVYGQFLALESSIARLPAALNRFLEAMGQRHPKAVPLLDQLRIAELLKSAGLGLREMAGTIVQRSGTVLEVLTLLIVLFFFVLYMASEGPEYLRSMRRVLPKRVRLEATNVVSNMALAHRGWFVALNLNMAASAALNAISLWLLGIPGAAVLGILVGLGEIVPNIGPGIMWIPTLVVTLLSAPQKVAWVVLTFVVVETLVGYVIAPWIFRRGVKLPSLVILMAVLVMGTLFGLLGVLVAIPMTADLVVFWNYLNEKMERDANGVDVTNPPAETVART